MNDFVAAETGLTNTAGPSHSSKIAGHRMVEDLPQCKRLAADTYCRYESPRAATGLASLDFLIYLQIPSFNLRIVSIQLWLFANGRAIWSQHATPS